MKEKRNPKKVLVAPNGIKIVVPKKIDYKYLSLLPDMKSLVLVEY